MTKDKFFKPAKLPRRAYDDNLDLLEVLGTYKQKKIKEKQKLINYLENGGTVEDLPKTKNISEKPY